VWSTSPRRCGITADIPRYPSTALGAAGVAPIEMTAAYNVFANQGVYVKPHLIRKIADQTDRVLEEQLPQLSEATQAQVAFELAHVMRGTIDRGTAFESATSSRRPLPARPERPTPTPTPGSSAFRRSSRSASGRAMTIRRRRWAAGETGAQVALPIWIDIFKQLDTLKLRTTRPEFDIPPGVVIVPMDLKTGRRGTGPCDKVIMEAFHRRPRARQGLLRRVRRSQQAAVLPAGAILPAEGTGSRLSLPMTPAPQSGESAESPAAECGWKARPSARQRRRTSTAPVKPPG